MAKDFKNLPTTLRDATAETFFSSPAVEPIEQTPPAAAPEPATAETFRVPDGMKLVPVRTKSARMQLLVYPDTRDKLTAYAKSHGTSVNAIANQLFEEFIEREGL